MRAPLKTALASWAPSINVIIIIIIIIITVLRPKRGVNYIASSNPELLCGSEISRSFESEWDIHSDLSHIEEIYER